MRTGRAGVVRGLLPVVPALVLVCGVAFGVLALSLAKPSAAQLEATHILEQLDLYRSVRSVQVVDGRHVNAVCREGRLRVGRGRRWHALLVRFSTGDGVSFADHLIRPLGEPRFDGGLNLALVHLILAGCPRLLARELAAALRRGHVVPAGTERIGNTEAIGLRFRSERDLIEVFVRRGHLLPVGLEITTPRFQGSSQLALAGPTD